MKHPIPIFSIILLVCCSTFLAGQPFEGLKGDVNNDGNINVLDMVSIANHILGTVVLDAAGLWRADTNGPEGNCDGDGGANVLDMVKIANMIMGSVKTRIQDEIPSLEISIPSVVEGRQIKNRPGEGMARVAVDVSIGQEHRAQLSLLYREGNG